MASHETLAEFLVALKAEAVHRAGGRQPQGTGDLRLVQRALAHADIKSTLAYAHALDGGLRAALESRNSPGASEGMEEFSLPDQLLRGRRGKGA